MAGAMKVFDRGAVRRHRERASPRFAGHRFLVTEVAERLADRLSDVTRDFAAALDLGCHSGELAATLKGRGGIRRLVQADLSEAMVRRASGPRLVCDEELLPFAPASFDLILSVLSLHWVNDLPGTLAQIARCLKPDGLFLAALLGGETLTELRQAFIAAELEEEGGASPRVSPFVELRDAGGLLQRAGLALPVVDSDTITVTYGDALELMAELRGMGESNAVVDRRHALTRRATLFRAAELYRELYADGDGRLPATFQVLTLTAWAPHDSQQKALAPGSARARLAEALGADEHSAGEKARPGSERTDKP
jgi:SAM-dependent methyltransferase